MTQNLGYVAASSTVRFAFTTHDKDGGAIGPSSAFEAADLLIYKDGGTTERSSTNGVTITSAFDSKTGLHVVAIDLSDNTDAGFYADGSTYFVVLSPDETVDTETVISVLAQFTIGEPVWAGSPTDLGGGGASLAGNLADIYAIVDATQEAVGDITANTISGVLTTALADVYAANGNAPTLQQAIMAIHQALMAFEIVGTEIRVKKLDGTTAAFTVTTDSATAPTEAIRS